MKEKWKLYLWLIRVNLFISAFTFGGGYVVVPMVKKYFVYGKGYFDEDELMEIAAIAQSTPGCHRGEPGLSGRLPGGRHCGACDQRRLCGDPASCDPVGDLRLLFCGDLQRPGGGGLKRHAGRSGRADRGFYRGHDRQGPEGEILLLDGMVFVSFGISFFTDVNVIFVLLGCCGVCMAKVWINAGKER